MALRYPSIRKAEAYQRADAPAEIAARRIEPALTRSVASALRSFRLDHQVERMASAHSGPDAEQTAAGLKFPSVETGLSKAFASIVRGVRAGADLGPSTAARPVEKDILGEDSPWRDLLSFSLFGRGVVELLKEYQQKFISALTEDMRRRVLDIVLQGVALGESPERIAVKIRDVIGLTERQAAAVENFRTGLERGDTAAQARASALGESGPAAQGIVRTQTQIDALVQAYADRALDYRAGMIARTESVRAVNVGLRESYRQAVRSGVFPAAAVRMFWLVDLDEKLCPVCAAIPGMNEAGVGVDDPFKTPVGDVMNSPIHPNCRCGIKVVTNLDMMPRLS